MAQKIIRHELVEIIIPANSTLSRFNFPDIPNLRNSHLLGMQIYNTSQITKSVISQNTLVSETIVQQSSFVTLVNYGGKEFLKQSPSVLFNTLQDDRSTSTNHHEMNFKSFVGQKVNWPKSYIEFTATASTASDTSFLVSVYYTLSIAEEERENGYSFGKKG